jgi:hypothetical protein
VRLLHLLLLLAALPIAGFAQQDLDAPQDYIANTVTFPLQGAPQQVNVGQVSVQLLDNPGPASYCYWIVSNFTIGNSTPAGPVCVSNGPNTLVNGIRVSWAPIAGASTYDVLRTSTQVSPSGACGCAIATAVSGLSATDTGMNAYTVTTFAPAPFNMVWDNEAAAAGQSQLVLRANGQIIFSINSATGFSGGGSSLSLNFGGVQIPLSNVTYPKAYAINLGTGNTDLYTVPANRKAILVDIAFTSSVAAVIDAEVKISGVYHSFDFVCRTGCNSAIGSENSVSPFLFGAGETLAVNSTLSGPSVWPYVIEFDSTAVIFDSRLFALGAGNNTLFTAPTGKTTMVMGFPANFQVSTQLGHCYYYNESGGSRTVQINIVPSAGSPAANNAVFNSSVLNGQTAQPLVMGGLAPGDFVNVNVDANTASQMAYLIYTTR